EVTHGSGCVAFDRFLVANVRAVRVETRRAPRPSLTQQVPALVQRDLEPAESRPVGVGHLPVRFALEELVLLARKLVDASEDFLIVHDLLLPSRTSPPGAPSPSMRVFTQKR